MTRPFDVRSLQTDYAWLDGCPDTLFEQVVTVPVGSLEERVRGVTTWREALLAGHLPPRRTWPSGGVDTPIRAALDQMGLARFCKGQPELVDALMRDVLEAVRRSADRVRSEILEELRRLEALERARLAEAERDKRSRGRRKRRKRGAKGKGARSGDSGDGGSGPAPEDVDLDDATLARLQEQAEALVAEASTEAAPDADLLAAWQERARAWAEIAEVFGDLGNLLGRGWDLSTGVLSQTGWTDLVRLSQLVAQLPQLREIVQSLGRLQVSDDGPSVSETVLEPVRRLEEELREIPTPLVPAEVRGIERSGSIARMLPVEAAMLGHDTLRILWHARRAERALLTYRVQGVEVERIEVETEVLEERERERPRPERGPIIAVVDTSGSMSGTPERVAKALVLEALRTAHQERRRCLLYAYGGPGEVVHQELDLSSKGLGRLLSFLGLSFGAGTDIGAVQQVVDRLQHGDWRKADVLLVTDGQWHAPARLVQAVADIREETGARFHGVQVGAGGRRTLEALCDPVHVFTDWAALGGWGRR